MKKRLNVPSGMNAETRSTSKPHARLPLRATSWLTAAVIGVVVTSAALSPLDAQQLGYTVIPTATRITWDDALPLDEGWLYGGRLSLLFGSQVELQPFFLRGTKFGVDSSRGANVFGANSLRRSLRIEHSGANVQLNLSTSDVSPFVRIGGGILKFTPDSGAEVKRLSVLAGGGFRLNLGGVQGEVFAEQLRFRLTPTQLFGGPPVTPTTGEKAPMLRNLTYGAALAFPLSTFEGEQTSGLRGARAPFEPFVGRLAFNSESGLGDQDLMGIRTGLDFSPLVGVRGFYWRGVNRDHDRTVPISGYGGEAQFTLNSGRGVTPYVVMGAGRIDFAKDFTDSAGQSHDDQSALIIGGGANFGLTDRVHLNVAIRDFVTTRSDQLSSAGEPDDLLHNRLISAGFTFSLGGTSGTARERERAADRAAARVATERTPGRSAPAVMDDNAKSDRTTVAAKTTAVMEIGADSVRVASPDSTRKTVVLPVPTVGEIIIRYGLPPKSDSTSPDATLKTIRQTDTVRVGQGTPPSGVNTDRVSDLERQVSGLEQELAQARRERSEIQRGQERLNDRRSTDPSVVSRMLSARPSDVTPFAGFSVGDGFQIVAAGRVDLGPMNSVSAFDLVPELSIAVGEGRPMIMGMLNARYSLGVGGSIRPYAMVGGGLSTNTLLVLGTSVGASANFREGDRKPLYGFAEIQGINLFNQTRLLIGISTRR